MKLSLRILALSLALAGCASIPPDTQQLPQQDLATMQLAADIHLASEGWPAALWWRQFQDAQLDQLIESALSSSPNLDVANARIGSALSAFDAQHAQRGPRIDLGANASRQRYSGNGLMPAPIGGNYYNETTVGVQAHYDLDWWGKHKAQIAASLGEVNARRAEYAMAEQMLAAEIARHYFSMQNGWARMDNLHALVKLQQQLVLDKEKRIANGLGVSDDHLSAQTRLSLLQQQIALLETQVVTEREALRALLGADASALASLQPRQAQTLPHALPGKLGMELLARRPDLQAARWRVQAAMSTIEAAQASFYPDIDLGASFGLDAIKLGKLLQSGSRTLFIGPALSLPLFDSGRLQAQLAGARSERNELIADYNQNVFNVVRDVAQAGARVQGVENQLRLQQENLRASEAQLRNANARLKQGLADRATQLNAEMTVRGQVDLGMQLQNQRQDAEINLTVALGGGYRGSSDFAAGADTAPPKQ
ncbi:efflux transporter outer membrane subunit [Janthinobacterium sp. SUN033]|uniref:efflux transporter outer membrane subunit n=1 Tax=Janthinobacterium sp. SUN033 TaxID=3002439 RepID=UPI0025B02FF2|nr:efflux transporter outer membrane subunit [Janthinobacterium sp. SUN033]MDN2676167.1 efflux transporter outer membrane subunit [Janthinobacterium sp. SUN033]